MGLGVLQHNNEHLWSKQTKGGGGVDMEKVCGSFHAWKLHCQSVEFQNYSKWETIHREEKGKKENLDWKPPIAC